MPPTAADQGSAKRQKSNVGSALKKPAGPDYEQGIKYWDKVDATVDGVLGGFGEGPVPHIDQLSSRLFLLSLLPSIHTFQSPLTPCPKPPTYRRTALDVGAGIGRVTRHVLLPLFDDVVLLEPVAKFVEEAHTSASSGQWRDLPKSGKLSESLNDEEKKENQRRIEEAKKGRGKRVWIVKGGLQGFDPAYPIRNGEDMGVVGEAADSLENENGFGNQDQDDIGGNPVIYDAIWCQWCLGHMSHNDLITFFRRSRAALRPQDPNLKDGYTSLIFVKENVCEDAAWGKGREFLDPEDSSLTRSNLKWLEAFKEAGLEVVKEEVQEGMPEELFMVKTWALR